MTGADPTRDSQRPAALNVNAATPTDANNLAELAARTFALACPPGTAPGDIAEFIAANLSPAAFAGYLADPRRRLWLARLDEATQSDPIGYAMTVVGPPELPALESFRAQFPGRDVVELSKFYLEAAQHHTGAARALMAAVIEFAHGIDAPAIWLGVNRHNERALRFYTKAGFEICGERTFRVGEVTHHDFVMKRAVSAGA